MGRIRIGNSRILTKNIHSFQCPIQHGIGHFRGRQTYFTGQGFSPGLFKFFFDGGDIDLLITRIDIWQDHPYHRRPEHYSGP